MAVDVAMDFIKGNSDMRVKVVAIGLRGCIVRYNCADAIVCFALMP